MTTPELVAAIKKNPITVTCGVLSLALAVAVYFRSGAIPEAAAELEERSAEGRRYALNLNNAAQLKEQFDALTAANKAIEARLIRASDIGINQQYFYRLETESGVKLVDLRQGARGTPKGGTVPIAFTVSAQGDYEQVLAFLRALENGVHFSRVQSGSCSGPRKGPVTIALNLELLGRP